ncbi:Similar to ppk28: Pickpocket protein 28 (Drosophila melanogaster) [Cotesia congregata]|uniref:Similar to ppk28: Pickpocket protein 28 (Drosophila melanogaster) n=1 Tax=Cotesia congregata TaxID=51543 RepID=A0A8J2H5X1_COTCN|nr:Similar to ppk28: Pickpocket protein 28 (Drosophila melanogaster) [Cotesia congregata]
MQICGVYVSEKRVATSVSVTCIFSSSRNPTWIFSIDKMSSETYIRKLRGFAGESTENESFTLNTVHLQNPYKVPQRFEGFSNSRHNALKLRSNLFPKVDDVDKTIQVRKNTWTQDDIKNILPTQKEKIQMCFRKIKFNSFLEQYCSNSTLHGLRYLGDSQVSWLSSPIIISMNPEPVSFEEFPFPSVTICNMNNAKKSEADRINNGNEDLDKLLLEDICNSRNETEVDEVFGSANWTNVLRFMINVSQPCNEMLHHCQWHGNVTDCERIFNPTLTDEGIQEWSDLNITFPFPIMDWKPETGYNDSVHPETQPWRPYGAGKYYGLTLVLDTNIKEYYCSSTASVGFKLLLHNPVETPKMADFGFAISPGEETRIVITPRINTASLSILGIPRKKRKCFFNTERKLKYYRTYTQRNCLLECEANFTQQICNCVQYYMPKSANTQICGKKDDQCANDARRLMEKKLYDDEAVADKLNVTEIPSCNCWPGCFEMNYEFTMSHSILTSAIHVDDTYIKNTNTGGLLGLFMGFSFLSVVEIFYFITLRLWCRIQWNERSKSTDHRKTSDVQPKIVYPFSQRKYFYNCYSPLKISNIRSPFTIHY